MYFAIASCCWLRQLLLALSLLGVCQQTLAFCPKNGLLCFVTAKSSGSLTHEDITQRAISELDKSYFSVPKLTNSMQKALDEIIEANAEVDQDQVSSAKHFDGENGAGAQLRLKTLKQNVLDALNASPINTGGARQNLGGALHTIQDFYSHSNWVEMGNSGANPDVGRSVLLPFAGPAVTTCSGFVDTGLTCANSSTIITSLLTSGYYGGEDRAKPGAFKCSHGGPLDKSSPSSDPVGYFREGINKDTLYCDLSPHSTFHHPAASAAIAATKQFVEDIKALINEEQLKALLGAGPTLAFAIDTTGSMGGIIAGVRASAINIVNSRLGTDEEPLQYVLAPFNDPSTGPTTSTSDATLFKSRIGALFASGGDDCPELSMTGMYNGLSLSNPGGNLFMYTDASSKDAGLFGAVLGLAKAKSIRLYMILFGSCSPLDPVYLQLANETGGQVFFLSGGEAGQVTQLADLVGRNNAVQVLSVVDTFPAAKTYRVPVDASMRRLTVSVSGTAQNVLPAVSLTRPDGVLVTPADAATYLSLSSGVIISIELPAIGAWTLKVDGAPDVTYVNVSGIADLAFTSFKLARFGGQPPHQGLFPIDGEPGPGDAVYGLAALAGGPANAAFQLRRKNDTPISDLALAQDATDPDKFFGPLTVPGETFLAYVTGKDASGNDYQRVASLALAPQNISVTAPAPQDLRPGKSTTLLYQVRNQGAAGTFSIRATDDLHYIVAVTPTTLTLGTGESASVAVTLMAPPDAPIGSADTITVAVQGTLNPLLHNSASLTSFVTGALETPGKPDFVADLIGQETVSSGVVGIDLRFTNSGIGTARDMTLTGLRLRTLSGSGTVTVNTALTPALPFVTPNVDVGSFFTVRLTFNVPAGVQRFSVTESGTVQGIDGAGYALSQGQAVIVNVP
ncbi:VCBS domain-containing protein [Janthinobacterium agaricidamnosum]|uniref:Novel domain protein n=1 Tax=Janthinobacterium agaricidamnosum NBRC 102515 = DSM 9628 TaxID=1349767 RepID=W0V2F8_9BURK|nr:VCBS domain-containing protein [Janthinobacterium agaricidamnosum]CDG82999.1 novel domain protein [Janthinobacterium agaricidamnosum NBRC 102515 = DSM 9628]